MTVRCFELTDAGLGGTLSLVATPHAGSVLGAWTGCENVTGNTCFTGFGAAPATITVGVRFDLATGSSCPNLTDPPRGTLKTGPRIPQARPAVADGSTNHLFDPDFENGLVFAGGLPSSSGYWAFDQAWSAPSGQQGITAQGGNRMLHFVSSVAHEGQPLDGTIASEVDQLIDVANLDAQLIDQGKIEVEASAWFNRADPQGCSNMDSRFALLIQAYDGTMADYPTRAGQGRLGVKQETLDSDGNPGTWQEVTATFVLPAGTKFFSVLLAAYENNFADPAFPEFHGHYADNASVIIRQLP